MATECDREIFEFGDTSMPETGGAHHDRLHRLVHVATDEQLQRRAVDVLGEDEQRPIGPLGHLDRGHDLLHRRDLLVGQQDHGIVEDSFHAVGIGDHVAGDVAVVEFDAVDDVDREAEGVALLGGDHSGLADMLDGRCDHVADDLVVTCGQRCDPFQVAAAADLDGLVVQ